MSTSNSPGPTLSKGAKRRANSCKPCRDSKSKCSGGIPCTTCQKKRQKPRCVYLSSISREDSDEILIEGASSASTRREPPSAGAKSEAAVLDDEDAVEQADGLEGPHDDFYGMVSLARVVEEFKQVLPEEGQFQDLIESIQPLQIFDLENQRTDNVSSSLPATLEPMKHDPGLQLQPALRRLFHKYYSIKDLLTAGLAMQAWSAFASLIRDAEVFGLKEHTETTLSWDDKHDPEPSRQLWWLLVQLDTQLSFLLGRRPSIDPSENVPKPALQGPPREGEAADQDILKLSEYMSHFLNHVHQDPDDRHSVWEDKRGMLQSELHRLQKIQSDLPTLAASVPLDATAGSMARHQIDIHLVLIVLYCQTLRSSSPENTKGGRPRHLRKTAQKNYYKDLLKSLRATIDIFDYSYELDPANAASSWPRCFGVFCATSMLGIAGLQQKVDVGTDSTRIQGALKIFSELAKAGQAPGIAQLATETLTEILDGIAKREQQASRSKEPIPVERIGKPDHVLQPSVPRANKPATMIKTEPPSLKRSNTSNLEGDTRGDKRARSGADPMVFENAVPTSSWQDQPSSQTMSFDATTAPLQEPIAPQDFEQILPSSAATSFNEQMDFFDAGYVPNHPDSFVEWHPAYGWIRPPRLYGPPLFDPLQQAQFQAYDNITPGLDTQQGAYPSLALSMDQIHQENSMQHRGFAPVQQTSPTHAQGLVTMSAAGVHSSESTPIMAHPLGDPEQTQSYIGARSQQGHGHAVSSPGIAASHMESASSRPGPDRRRSVADIRQERMGLWTTDSQMTYNERVQIGNPYSDDQGRRQSPPRAGMQSTNTGQIPLGEPTTMQELQAQQGRSMPPARRQSNAHMVGSGFPNIAQQQQWQATQQPSQVHYDARAHIPYNATMTSEEVLEYNEQLQYHQHQQHIPVVTTGPLAGDGQGQHWRWTG